MFYKIECNIMYRISLFGSLKVSKIWHYPLPTQTDLGNINRCIGCALMELQHYETEP